MRQRLCLLPAHCKNRYTDKFKKFADLNRRVLKTVQQYDSRDYVTYLKDIAYNILS